MANPNQGGFFHSFSIRGIDFDYECRQSFNKLIASVYKGDEKTVKKLLRNNWSPNSTDNQGRTAVHLAARSSTLHKILRRLLRHGGVPDHVTHSGTTALCLAAYAGAVKNVALLLEHGASVNIKNSIEATPLHFACNGHSVEVVKLLVEAGAQVNAQDFYNITPLMLAVTSKRNDIARYLLQNGADLLLKDSEERTVFHEPCSNDDIELFEILIKKYPNPSELGNIVDSEGWTTLMLAAQSGSVKITERLVQLGSDTSKTNSSGLMALHLAAHNSLECFKLLLEATPIEAINTNCTFNSKLFNNSLPCLLLDKFCLEGLKLLLSKPNLDKGVLLCPSVKDSCLYPPVPFSFSFGAGYDFTSSVIQLYIDNSLPLDLEFSKINKNITCLESLIASHILYHTDWPVNVDKTCQCPKLFVTLLENGAKADPHKVVDDLPSNSVLWYFCNHGSKFGLSYLLRYSNILEPSNILNVFTGYLVDRPINLINEPNSQTIELLCKYSMPWDVTKCKIFINAGNSSREFKECLRSFYHRNDVPFPTLKLLCRPVLRKHVHRIIENSSRFQEHNYNISKTFRDHLDDLPIPSSLSSFLQFDDIIADLKSNPNYPSFEVTFQAAFV